MDNKRIDESLCIQIPTHKTTSLYTQACFEIGRMFTNFTFADLYNILPKYSFYRNESSELCFCHSIKTFINIYKFDLDVDMYFALCQINVLINITKQHIAIYDTDDLSKTISKNSTALKAIIENLLWIWDKNGCEEFKIRISNAINVFMNHDGWYKTSKYHYKKITKCVLDELNRLRINAINYSVDKKFKPSEETFYVKISDVIDGLYDDFLVQDDDIRKMMLDYDRHIINQKISSLSTDIDNKIIHTQQEILRLTKQIQDYQEEIENNKPKILELKKESRKKRLTDYELPK